MNSEANIILAGAMGSGKTSVGRIVAKRLGREFRDTDRMIEEITGLSIARIFSERSEAYFRNLEREVIAQIRYQKNLVVAVGGGSVIPKENRDNLAANGVIICLCATSDTLKKRLADQSGRPLLSGGDVESRIEQILAERKAIYDSLEWKIITDDLSLEEVADAVIEILDPVVRQ